jgi:hypothetical protein
LQGSFDVPIRPASESSILIDIPAPRSRRLGALLPRAAGDWNPVGVAVDPFRASLVYVDLIVEAAL